MPKAGFIVTRISFCMLAASMLGAAMLAAPAAGQTSTCPSSGKCFAVVVSQGGSASFSFAITNEASTQTLGSVQITALAGFVITSAPGAASVSPDGSSALFINLNLAPGATTSTPLTVNVKPSSSGAKTYQWGIQAKQSNDFKGTGNDFQLDSAASVGLTGSISSCSSSTCSGSASSATTSGSVTTSSAPPDDFITTGIESASIVNYDCITYLPVSDAFSFDVFKSTGAVDSGVLLNGTLRIFKSSVIASGHTGASSWQICYAVPAPMTFPAQPGTTGTTMIGGVTYNTGQLLDCPNTNPQQSAPCVQSRNKNNAGDVIVTFLAKGDPVVKG
jgi:hypothetical protein